MKKKFKKLFSGAGMFALCSMAAKFLGALFRIPLTNIVGAEGMGLYQMVFPLYAVLLTISSGGINTAITKTVSCARANSNERGTVRILKITLISLSVLAVAAALVLILFRGRIAAAQGNSLAALAYLGIAPSILFVAVTAALRGFFQGYGNMLPSGLSQIAEQAIKLIFGLYLAARLMPRGIQYAILGATLGVTLSELASMLILVLQFCVFYERRRRATVIPLRRLNAEIADFSIPAPAVQKSASAILKSVYAVAIPVTLGALIMPLTQLIDSVMVINVLALRGMERGTATSLFGLVGGPVGSLINMPVAVTLALSVALLPKIAFFKERGKCTESECKAAANQKISRFLESNTEVSEEFLSKGLGESPRNSQKIPQSSNSQNKSSRDIDSQMEKSREFLSGGLGESQNLNLQNANSQNTNAPESQQKTARIVGKSLVITLLLCLPCAALFMFFPRQIVAALYSRGLTALQSETAAQLLRIESLSVIYIGIVQICTAVLQGADKPHRPAINLLYGAIIKVLLTLALLPRLGIKGAAVASVLCYGTVAIIDIIYLKKIIRPQIGILKSVIMPLFGCATLVVTTFFLLKFFTPRLPPLYAFIAAAGCGAIVYALFLLISRTVRIKELLS